MLEVTGSGQQAPIGAILRLALVTLVIVRAGRCPELSLTVSERALFASADTLTSGDVCACLGAGQVLAVLRSVPVGTLILVSHDKHGLLRWLRWLLDERNQ